MTTAAPTSPPMASSAMRTLLGIKVLETCAGVVLNERGPQNGVATNMAAGQAPRRTRTGARQ